MNIKKDMIEDIVGLTSVQEGMLFHYIQEQDSSMYFEQLSITMLGEINYDLFCKAWKSIVQNNEVLRTVYKWEKIKAPIQIVLKEHDPKISYHDFSNSDEGKSKLLVDNFKEQDYLNKFDLEEVAFRVALCKIEDARYEMIISNHHILYDGWSNGIILKEFFQAYNDLSNNKICAKVNKPKFKEFVKWTRSIDKQSQQKFWKDYLTGYDTNTEIPFVKNTPKNTHCLEEQHVALDKKQIDNFTKEHGLTLATLIYTAWGIVLQKYNSSEDAVFGTTVSGRVSHIKDIDNMVGLFINTIPLRVKSGGQEKIIDVLRMVNEDLKLRVEYESTPLVSIKKYCDIKTVGELFDSIVVIDNYPLDGKLKEVNSKLHVDSFEIVEKTNYDLTIGVKVTDEVEVSFSYTKGRFQHDAIKNMTEHFENVFNKLINDCHEKICNINMLSIKEYNKVMYEFNDTYDEYPSDKVVVEIFEKCVATFAENIALYNSGKEITYKELNDKVNVLAHVLREKGVKANSIVGIMTGKTIDMIVGILAIIKAGGAYMPIDPEYPLARKKFMIEDSGSRILLTQQEFIDNNIELKDILSNENIVVIDKDELNNSNNVNPTIINSPRDLISLIYTSGTTGKPKGVMIEHRNVVNVISWFGKRYSINEKSKIIQLTNYIFDVSIEDIFGTLLNGGTLYLPDKNLILNNDELYKYIDDNKINLINFIPTILKELLGKKEKIESLNIVISGGEKLDDYLKEELITKGYEVYNNYGPAETTVDALSSKCTSGKVTLGRPISNVTCYILDKHNKPVPIGVRGELFIGGHGVTRGYLNNDDLTQVKFVKNELFKDEIIYKTGDIARWMENGDVDFLGRQDFQVKIRGFRIELGEIENKLMNYQGIESAVVIDINDNGRTNLCAYFVSHEIVDIKELKEYLFNEVPKYMVPSYFVQLDKIPLTNIGKVDRKALPVPELKVDDDYIPASNEIELNLVKVWAEVLGIEENSIGIKHNFFELGGDSILSMQIVSKAMQKGIKITVNQIFQYQTIYQLAKVASKVEQCEGAKVVEVVTGDVLLTPIEKWFFEEDFKNNNHWNQSVLLETKENFDYKILCESLNILIKHHDAFRLRFEKKEGNWIQYYSNVSENIECQLFDLSNNSEEDRTKLIENEMKNLQGCMNISTGPLYRVAYFKLGENQKGQLFITIHHLAVDGYSWRILLEDLQNIYEQLEKGKEVVIPEKTASFKQWAEQLKKVADSELINGEIDYWLNTIPDEIKPIFVDNSEGINDENSARVKSYSLPKEETNNLIHNIGNAYKTKINDILLSSLALTFADWTEKLIVDMEGHGREEKFGDLDISRTVGWFTSVYPVVLDCRVNEKTIEDIIKENKENIRHMPNNGSGYGLLYYMSDENNLINLLKSKPQAQVSFNYLGQFDNMLSKGSLFKLSRKKVGYTHYSDAMRSHMIEIDSMIANGELIVEWKYSTNIHKDETIDKMAQNFIENLKKVIDHCMAVENTRFTPSDFPLININQQQIDMLCNKYKDIEDIYSLSPVQQSMIFHHVYSPDSSVTVEQTAFTIDSKLDINAFEKVWQTIVNKHTSLRASFYWHNIDEPIQIIHKDVKVPFEILDWQSVEKVDLESKLERFLEEDRKKGYDLGSAPLMRIYVIKLDVESYYIVWSHHHLQLDGWCLNILLKEIGSFYEAYSSGQKVEIKSEPEFKEYLSWLKGQDMSKSERFWTEELKGFKEPILLSKELACYVKDVDTESKAYENIFYDMGEQEHKKLLNVAKKYRITLNTIIQGAWAILLSKYTGQKDIVFGTTSSGRPIELPGVESMVGCFMNTIPMRINVDEKYKIEDWLKKIQLTHANIRQFDYTPLALIRNCSEVPRDSGLYDLYESIVIFENYPFDLALKEGLGSLKGGYVKVEEQMDYPITLYCNLQPELSFNLLYDKKYFSEEMVKQILKHLINIINEIGHKKDAALEDIVILNQEEVNQLLVGNNNTAMDYPKELCYHNLFENYVKVQPDHLAVIQENNQITYKELDKRANKLANKLVRMGVSTDVLVGICVERSIEMIVAMLGVMKAGGAVMAIDSEYPKERINAMLEDAQAFLLITQRDLLPETANGKVIYIDSEWFEIEEENDSNPKVDISPANLAYVIFTSGSSGKPKGVLMNHEAVVSHTIDMQRCYDLHSEDRVLQFTSISFDISLEQVFSTLGNGGTLVLRDKEVWTPSEFAYKCKEFGLTVTNLPTAYWHQVVQDWANDVEIVPYEKLRLVIVGGEQILPERVALWSKYPMNKIRLLNAYGPAETAMTSTLYDVSESNIKDRVFTPVGKPLANRRIYVLDERMKPVPIGVKGEIYIGGIPIARGYLNRDELTKEKFIKDPYYEGVGDRLYRTGDIGRVLSDGNIEVVGRKDEQIKIRSHRIEIGEIQTVISELKEINNISVIAKGKTGEYYLVAYYTVKDNCSLTQEDIKEYLGKRVPKYMIPSYFVELQEMPITPNGKIDKKSLPEFNSVEIIEDFEAPRDVIEIKLSEIWKNVLDINEVSINSSFFELGGHSLKAIMLTSKIRQELNVDVPLVKIFELSTIKTLGEYIKNAIKYEYNPIDPIEERDVYQVSAAQKRLFILNEITNNDTNYNMPYALILNGEINKDKIEEVLRKLIERHESFRTSFDNVDGEIVQKINKTVDFKIQHLENRMKSNIDEEIKAFISPFDLSKAPLFRVALMELETNKHLLMFDMHHIITDGISIGIFIKEFIALYEGQSLPELKIHYKDFAVWQNKLFESDNLKVQEQYWVNLFKDDIPVLNMPTDYPRGKEQILMGEEVKISLNNQLTSKLKELAIRNGATLYSVLMASFNVLLHKYSGQSDIVIGSPVAGRGHIDTEALMGMFVNTVAIRNYPTTNKDFKEFLNEVSQNSLNAFENQDYQFEKLVDKLQISRELSRNPLFDVMFVWQNMDIPSIDIDGLNVNYYEYKNNKIKFDLELKAFEEKEEIKFILQYCTALFKKETIQNMANHYIRIIEQIIENEYINISDIKLLNDGEVKQLVEAFNDTKANYPKNKSLKQLFEEQVENTPNNVALVFEGESLTFTDLNMRANQLARHMQNEGVKPRDIVAIRVEPSLETIISMIAVLKIGAAYLPIDYEFPIERVKFIFEDSKCTTLLTKAYLNKNLNFDGKVIYIEDKSLYTGDYSNLKNEVDYNDLAYVIYTSGTTGVPKGVLIKNHSVVNYINWFKRKAELKCTDKTVLISSFAFDLGYTSLYSALLTGCEMHIMTKDSYLATDELIDYMNKNNISYIKTTPSMFNLLAKSISDKAPNVNECSLRLVVLGGEEINLLDVERFNKFSPQTEFINHYGPTEATIGSIACKIDFERFNEYKLNPVIGYPIDNANVFILDSSLKPVPIGVNGEIYITGEGLAYGYLNRPELNDEKFIDNPYNINGYSKLYRTGDLGRYNSDGTIAFIGRKDHQVKIRGYRVELGEIETQILSHESVNDVVVICKKGNDNINSLCAYVVGENEIDFNHIREFLMNRLPEYMIPSYFIKLDKIPLNENGKTDMKALPDHTVEVITDGYVAPKSEIEKKLVEIWTEILGVEGIGINNNFFQVGGHSLRATVLVSKIYKAFNVKMPLREIFRNPTVKGIASFIENAEGNKYEDIVSVDKREYYPASSSQKRLYTLFQLDKNGIEYNMPLCMDIQGKLHVEKIYEVIGKLIKRHEGLRTNFSMIDNEVVQIVNDDITLDIEMFNDEDITIIMDKFIRPFNINEGPLFRVGLLKVDENKHILIFDMHHIIFDGVSRGILVEEFTKLYKGIELKDMEIQYKDYSVWQNKLLLSDNFKKQEEYWLETFKGELPILNMPYDYVRPAMQSFEGDNISFKLDQDITDKLTKICEESGSTLFMLLLSAYNVLLSKYSGQEDIIIGSPIAGRHHADLQNIIGMFVGTLALRSYPKTDKTFRSFVNEVRENTIKAIENQDYQFDQLVDRLNVRRDLSRNPLFDTMFVLRNMEIKDVEIEGLAFSEVQFENKISKFDLTLTAEERDGEIKLDLEYCTKLFKKETMERFSRCYISIIEGIVNNLDVKIGDIELLSQQELNQLTKVFNDTYLEYPKDKTLNQLFEEQVKLKPNNMAVIFEDKQLTYRELNEKANSLAAVLRRKGIKEDSIVGLVSEKSLEMVIGLMAIIKAGGAYLPIDPNYPRERIEYMLRDSESNLVLTPEVSLGDIEFNGEVISLSNESLFDENIRNLDKINNENSLAYVIYTSGTTGEPKGVMCEHKNVIRLVKNTNYIEFNDDDKILQTGSMVFDASTFEVWGALLNGIELHLAKNETIFVGENLERLIDDSNITILWLTSQLFNQIVQDNVKVFKNLRYLLVGGDVLSPKYINLVREQNKNLKVINGYGPTENTTFSTTYLIDKEHVSNIPIGKPIANSTAYIVDKNNKLAPIGVYGELCIGGDGLARGYLNKPSLTAEKFSDNPFRQGTKIYRTGDLARWLPDGNIEFLGRIDNQVKIRGFRIELGEIESKLLQNSDVKEATVLLSQENEENKYICAYIVSEKEINELNLKDYLKQSLPEYMIPAYFVKLDRIPITSNGKVDRRALPKPNLDERLTSYEAPRNAEEEILVKIWSEVLGIDKIGINDNFFELGGHSLKAMTLISKIHKETNKEIPLKELFRYPTIRELGNFVQNAKENIYSKIQKVDKKEYYEASSAQKRMYMLQQFDKNSIAYNMPVIFELKGKINKGRIEDSFKKLVNRHEALRSYFDVMGGEVVQKIDEHYEFNIIERKDNDEIETIINKFIKPFELDKAPLFRVQIVENRDQTYLLIDMHHIMSDGMSISVLMKEFAALYNGESLQPLKLQYKDFAAWQNNLLKSEEMKKQEAYWTNMFSDEIPILNLPYDYERPIIQSFEGDSLDFSVGADISKELRSLAKETGTTLHMILLSAFNILLAKYSGQEDIVVGVPISGRPHSDIQNIVGMFVNTLALRNKPEGDKNYLDFLKEVRENSLMAYENQSYQLEALVEKLSIKRDISRNPLFDVMFNMIDTIDNGGMDIEDLSLNQYECESKISKFDLTLCALEDGDKLSFNLQYCSDLFMKETIERLSKHYVSILYSIVSNKGRKICELELLEEKEKEKILYDFNNTKAEYPKNKTIKELFEEQVELAPNNFAVVFEGNKLTYKELNEKSNNLARVLRSKGVKADSIVGIMVERSLEMIVGIMAILKSGGAYLPIDPNYPKERTEYMLKDSGCKVLLSEKSLVKNIELDGEFIDLFDYDFVNGDLSNLENVSSPNDLAYIIYTSGTTGKPKGVMIENRNVINLATWAYERYKLIENKNILFTTSITFDPSINETLTVLINGGTIFVAEKELLLDKESYRDYIITNNINMAQFVPITLKELISNNEKMECLRVLTCGGDKLDVSTKNQVISMGYELYDQYGPTEATVICITTKCQEDENIIGTPLANTQSYIISKYSELQPIGVIGELCIGGDGVGRGYLNNIELTQEKFINNPFVEGSNIYRTGDMARWLPDGTIEFLGRVDNQVKIRGFRIELAEIESRILQHEDVREAVVIAREDINNEKSICAYVVSEKEINELNLRGYLKERLPEYMVPAYFVKLDKMPLTANGKLDRKALPQPEVNRSLQQYEVPRNEIEIKLTQIWSEVLGCEKVGINDNFFELGGHSLKAMTLIYKIHKEINREVPLKELFKSPTIKGISEFIQSSIENAHCSIEKVEEKESYEASSAQKRMYIIQQFNKESISYNMPQFFEIKGMLDNEKIEDTFRKLIKRHEALRTYFENVEGEIIQKIDNNYEFELRKRVENRTIEEISDEFIKPFDLGKAPLFRVEVINTNEENYLLIDMHHIISDGVSMSILMTEFAALYNGDSLEPLNIQYKDFSAWQNNFFKTEELAKQEEYWSNVFDGDIPILELPYDYDRPSVKSGDGSNVDFEIDKAITTKLKELSKNTGATMHMVILSAFNILLSKYSGQEDIVVGIPIAGRRHPDTQGVMGLFVNTLAIRNKPEGNKKYIEFLEEVKENSLKAYENQDYQIEALIQKLNIDRNESRNPLFDVSFNTLNIERENIELNGISLNLRLNESKTAKFDLNLSLIEEIDNLKLNLIYSKDLFNRESIEIMRDNFIEILRMIADNEYLLLKDIFNDEKYSECCCELDEEFCF